MCRLGCPGNPRVDLEQLLASDEAWHTLLLAPVTLEEDMRIHLGKGDTSIASSYPQPTDDPGRFVSI